MNQVLYTQNIHYQRAEDDSAREARVAKIIARANLRDAIEWALTMFCVWLFAMAVDVYKTFYTAWMQTGQPLLGLSAFIGLGVIFTGMCFGAWKWMR